MHKARTKHSMVNIALWKFRIFKLQGKVAIPAVFVATKTRT